MKPGFYVTTWDAERQRWTPQQGVRTGPWSKWGLRRALRALQACGYPCHYRSHDGDGDVSVKIEHYSAEDVKYLNAHRAVKAGANP